MCEQASPCAYLGGARHFVDAAAAQNYNDAGARALRTVQTAPDSTRDLQASVDDSGTAVIAHSSLATAEDAGSSSRTGAAVLKTDFSSASFGPPMLRGRHYVETTILEPGTRGCFIGLVPAKSYNHRWVSERASGTSVTFCMRALPRGLCWLTIH